MKIFFHGCLELSKTTAILLIYIVIYAVPNACLSKGESSKVGLKQF